MAKKIDKQDKTQSVRSVAIYYISKQAIINNIYENAPLSHHFLQFGKTVKQETIPKYAA